MSAARTLRCVGYAPGSIGNLGPGLDMLGLALAGCGDRVEAAWDAAPGVIIDDAGHPDLPVEATLHSAGIAAREVLRAAGALHGVRLRVTKGLPLAAGQGGSAASAVAAAVAVNALIDAPLDRNALFAASLAAECAVAGRHGDNIAPSLLGGIVIVRSLEAPDLIALPVPATLRVTLAHPAQRLRTADARAALPREVPLATVVQQMANVAALVAALAAGDLALLGRALDDAIAEPARTPLLPGFADAKAAAVAAGALGGSISGSGPTAFMLSDGDAVAARVGEAMRAAYAARGIAAHTTVHRVDTRGAYAELLA